MDKKATQKHRKESLGVSLETDIDSNFEVSTDNDDEYKLFEEYLNQNQQSKAPKIEPNDVEKALAEIKKNDHETLNQVLIETLSPELIENEQQKRQFKRDLMKFILVILSIQLAAFVMVIFIFSFAYCFNFGFLKVVSISQLEPLIGFLKYYVVSIFAEFVAMLFFIVRFVFDKSIVDLIKQFFEKN